LSGSGPPRRTVGHPGVALLLLQVADVAAGLEARARPFHPAHEALQHPADPGRRGGHRPLRPRLLRGRGRSRAGDPFPAALRQRMTEEAKFQVPWRWAIGTAAVLAAVLGIVGFRCPAGMSAATAGASRIDLVVPILSDGSLEPPPGGELRAPEAATVASIPAREGERVARDAPLVVLESPELAQ